MKLLTLARDLQRRKSRERSGLFVAEGVRTAEELLRSPLVIRGAVVAPSLATAPRGAALREALTAGGVTQLEVTEHEFATASDTEAPQGVLLVAEVPARTLEAIALPAHARVLVLDAIQDPGNAGALLRTAAALGVSATIALPGTVDLWNGKVVRSAMGALFRHSAVAATSEALGHFLAAHNLPLWGADLGGEPLTTVSPPPRLALALGNEGAGLTAATRAMATRVVTVPISADVESLNVTVAAGILLYALRP